MPLPTRCLGPKDAPLTAACIGLGCMSLTPGFYGPDAVPEEQAVQLIRTAVLEAGAPLLLNTSDLYGASSLRKQRHDRHSMCHARTYGAAGRTLARSLRASAIHASYTHAGPFTNEQLLGKALRDVPRESFVIATKVCSSSCVHTLGRSKRQAAC